MQAQAPSQVGSLQAGDHRISTGANSLAQKTFGVSQEKAKLPASWTTAFGLTRQQAPPVRTGLPTAFLNKHPRAAVQIFKNHKSNGEKRYEGKRCKVKGNEGRCHFGKSYQEASLGR